MKTINLIIGVLIISTLLVGCTEEGYMSADEFCEVRGYEEYNYFGNEFIMTKFFCITIDEETGNVYTSNVYDDREINTIKYCECGTYE